MEQKKIISILYRDMVELEELIEKLKEKVAPQAPEVRFLHTRAQGMKELMEILHQSFVEENEVIDSEEKIDRSDVAIETVEEESEKQEESESAEVKTFEQLDTIKEELPIDDVVISFEPEAEEEMEEVEEFSDETEEPEIDSDEHKRVGESFKRETSVNDRAADNKNLDYKLGQSKIESLQAAIGINDRFLFVRELFDGDTEKYKTAIATIDSKHSLKEAVDYLSQNFKWKKTNASISFVKLLKRRF